MIIKRGRKGTNPKWLCGALCLALLAHTGCGTLFYSGRRSVVVATTPLDTNVTVNGVPGSSYEPIEVSPKRQYRVIASRQGYQTETARVKSKVLFLPIFMDVIWIAALGTGILFLIIDLSSGSVYIPGTEVVTLDLDVAADSAVDHRVDEPVLRTAPEPKDTIPESPPPPESRVD